MDISEIIVRPLTADGRLGFDKNRSLVAIVTNHRGRQVLSHITDVRDKVCVICNRGWTLTADSFMDQWLWVDMDKTVHETCMARYVSLSDQQTVRWAMRQTSLDWSMRTIPNDYMGNDPVWGGMGRPWYELELLDQPYSLIIGRRKRVWEIRLVPVNQLKHSAQLAATFADEDVTKGFSESGAMIHAWTDGKLYEYLVTMCKTEVLATNEATTTLPGDDSAVPG